MRHIFLIKKFIVGIIIVCIGIGNSPTIKGNTGEKSMILSDEIHHQTCLCEEKPVPDCVEVGDLLLFDLKWDESNRWKRPGPYNEHGAIYIGNNSLIDANPKGVYVRNYSHYYYNWKHKNLVFLRVKTANDSQRHAAVDWAVSKIGIQYQNFFWSLGLKTARTNLPIPYADKFYCIEFVWAAYYMQGVDIDRNGWNFPWWVTGNDIIYDDDVEIVYREVNDSLEFIKPYKGVYIANRKITSSLNAMNDTVIFGGIDIEVVTYNELVTHVDFYIDGEYKATDDILPYSWRWDDHRSGKKVIRAVACDDTGNQYPTNITVRKFF